MLICILEPSAILFLFLDFISPSFSPLLTSLPLSSFVSLEATGRKKARSINNCNHYHRQIKGLWISKENFFISLQICLHIWRQRPFWTLSYFPFKRSNKKIRGNIFFSFHSWKNKNQEWTGCLLMSYSWTKIKPRISESQFCVFTLWHPALP